MPMKDEAQEAMEVALAAMLAHNPTRFMAALSSISEDGSLFMKEANTVEEVDVALPVWQRGIAYLRSALLMLHGKREKAYFIAVHSDERHADRFTVMAEAVQHAADMCHANNPPSKIVVHMHGVEHELKLSQFV